MLQVPVHRGVAGLTLDSPANRNALSRTMRAELRSARCFATDEGQEGIAAFREERPARWVPA